ncbi:unnamed protein product, partial [Symbiodinium sp. CCMP2456]
MLPVQTQPPFSFGCVLAIPEWPATGIPVLFVCYHSPVRIFAEFVPASLSVGDVYRLAGIQEDDRTQIFVKDVPWAVPAEARIFVQPGDLISICPMEHALAPPLDFEQMFQAHTVWHEDPVFPMPAEDGVWLLTNQLHQRFAARRPYRTPMWVVVAQYLGISPTSLTSMPAWPPIRNHSHRGLASKQVFLAVRTPGSGRVPFVLDLRPVLLGISWASAPDGIVDVTEICNRQTHRCPPGHCVRLHGGTSAPDLANHFRRVHAGQTLTIEFAPRWYRGVEPLSGPGGNGDQPDADDRNDDDTQPPDDSDGPPT